MKKLVAKPNNDYLKPQGDMDFTKESVKLAYGEKDGLYAGQYSLD